MNTSLTGRVEGVRSKASDRWASHPLRASLPALRQGCGCEGGQGCSKGIGGEGGGGGEGRDDSGGLVTKRHKKNKNKSGSVRSANANAAKGR